MKNYITISVLIFSFICIPLFSQTQGIKIASPEVNGKLDNTEWSGAKVFTNFYKFIPKSDDNSFDSTTVYIKQTKDAIYFGFDYYPKGKIISKSLTRDRSTEDENEFFILLDLENKNQNGYMFAFSFLNNQRDAIIYNQRNQSSEWDWVWDVKSKIIAEAKDGKSGHIQTEVKIPVDRLQNKNKKQIGIDVQMFSYKEDGTYYYYSLIPGSELLSLKNTYQFDLVTPFNEKLNLNFNVIPFTVGQSFNSGPTKDTLIFGGDVNVSMDNHKLKATYNPDESTLEADPFRFNLYAQPIFLQEKRSFFSRDLDLFRTPINLFYTRAIDDIKYGFNYSYRSDVLKAGVVLVEDTDNEGDRRHFFVARPNMNFKDLNVGSLIINSNNDKTGYKETIFAFDGSYRFPDNPLRFQAQFANSVSSLPGQAERGTAYNFYGYYQYNDAGGPYADVSYNRVNPGFYASTYFNGNTSLPNNYDGMNVSGGYKFVFDRQYFSDWNINGRFYKLSTLETDVNFPSGFNFQNNLSINNNFKVAEWLRFNQYFEYNRPNSFDQNGNVTTFINTAQEYNASFFLGTNYLNVGYFFGPYFGDFLKQPYFSGNVFLFERLALSASMTFFDIAGEKRTILNTRMDWKVLPKFFIRSYFQRDNISQQALWNSIFQYEFFAGSSAYLVINMNGENLQYVAKYFKVGYDFAF